MRLYLLVAIAIAVALVFHLLNWRECSQRGGVFVRTPLKYECLNR